MKKTYLSPSVKMEEAETIQMLAESLYIIGEPVDGSYALVRTDNSWNIWAKKRNPDNRSPAFCDTEDVSQLTTTACA